MKNNIVLYMCVFLLLSSCSSDHDAETAIKNILIKQKKHILMK
ncbi:MULTISPECIES: hypothetical protein [Borreliella]|nr:hypothetical protein [Borreliella valaisiana]WLN25618.1 hypothetical protein KJD10_04295 [Borreliella valaisiana]